MIEAVLFVAVAIASLAAVYVVGDAFDERD
jgi:hypothetical protein